MHLFKWTIGHITLYHIINVCHKTLLFVLYLGAFQDFYLHKQKFSDSSDRCSFAGAVIYNKMCMYVK